MEILLNTVPSFVHLSLALATAPELCHSFSWQKGWLCLPALRVTEMGKWKEPQISAISILFLLDLGVLQGCVVVMMLYTAFLQICGGSLIPELWGPVLFTHPPHMRMLPQAVATWRSLPWQRREIQWRTAFSPTYFFPRVSALLLHLPPGDFPLCSPGLGSLKEGQVWKLVASGTFQTSSHPWGQNARAQKRLVMEKTPNVVLMWGGTWKQMHTGDPMHAFGKNHSLQWAALPWWRGPVDGPSTSVRVSQHLQISLGFKG